MMNYAKNPFGMTILELGIMLAVIGIVSVVALPGLQGWMVGYKLKGFARNVFADMQDTRMNAIKNNAPWEVEFVSNGYMIKDHNGNIIKNMKFADHGAGIKYGNPQGGASYDTNPLTFNSRGLLNVAGFVYITDTREKTYYRIGAAFTTGSIRVENWNGSGWQ